VPGIDLAHGHFSFQRRPIPVPGDLRIAWRVSLILVMLACSRSSRASLAKLHILNDAVRSGQHARLRSVLDGSHPDPPWNLRVEPAFARAIDFVVGENFATWTKATGRAALQLTKSGAAAAAAVMGVRDGLVDEKAIISDLAKAITETMVATLLGEGRKA
jgi:hypothetical protein